MGRRGDELKNVQRRIAPSPRLPISASLTKARDLTFLNASENGKLLFDKSEMNVTLESCYPQFAEAH